MRARGISVACVLVGLSVGAFAGSSPSPTMSGAAAPIGAYERGVRPRQASAEELRLFGVVQRWGKRHGQDLKIDPRLFIAAEALAGTPVASGSPGAAEAPIDLAVVRRLLLPLGVTDAAVSVLRLRAAHEAQLAEVLARELDAEIEDLELQNAGVAIDTAGPQWTAVVLLSRRLVRLVPTPARVAPGEVFTLAGLLTRPARRSATRVFAVVAYPNGTSDRRPVPVERGEFRIDLPAGETRGVLGAQLLVDRGRGPEVAASLDLGVGVSPFEHSGAVPLLPKVLAHDDPEQTLTSLLLALRDEAGLPRPAESASLAAAARAHADDMARHDFFAHRAPNGTDAGDRVAAQGLRCSRVVENLATAQSAEQVIRDWWLSPSHRANLLDRDIDAFGLSIVPTQREGAPLLAVLVMARTAAIR